MILSASDKLDFNFNFYSLEYSRIKDNLKEISLIKNIL